ncbi:MAG: hypothetical protein GXZ04_01940 [Clostridiales bacterium]|nr:hypothetical protein [Clostridiales bacterium]
MPYFGNYTKTDLRDLSWFHQVNSGQQSRGAARFGLELAQLSYDFEAGPWLSSGWTDMVIQVDARLLSGVRKTEDVSTWRQGLFNAFLPKLARGLTNITNPITDLRSYLQQDIPLRTGKAVVMIREHAPQRFTLAIGFMGTGRRPQDWASNMRLQQESHFHEGFFNLAAQFESMEAEIRFPTAAAALGLEDLSLRDVLNACKRPESPFRVIVAGHSQGAAVMQVWTHQKLKSGVQKQHLLGFGFASPSVAVDLPQDELICPLTHFLVADDLIPRVGMKDHLGTSYLLRPDNQFREVCYGDYRNHPLFIETLGLLNSLQDTQQGLLFALAFLDALREQPAKAVGSALAVFVDHTVYDLPALTEEWTRKLLRFTIVGFHQYYQDATGSLADSEAIQIMTRKVLALMDRFGTVALARMILKALFLTHSLVGPDMVLADHAPYSYLVVRAFDQLVPLQKKTSPLMTEQ